MSQMLFVHEHIVFLEALSLLEANLDEHSLPSSRGFILLEDKKGKILKSGLLVGHRSLKLSMLAI